MCNNTTTQSVGADPLNMQWTVVRGDTAVLDVKFLESDESTIWSTEGWTYKATVYDPQDDVLDDLMVFAGNGYVRVTAPASLTENWGCRHNPLVSELQFDVQVRIPADGEDTIWTPIIGTICVTGDITPGGSL
jgi:hypothetical protein